MVPYASPLETQPIVAAHGVRLLAEVLLRDDLSAEHTAQLLDLLAKVGAPPLLLNCTLPLVVEHCTLQVL